MKKIVKPIPNKMEESGMELAYKSCQNHTGFLLQVPIIVFFITVALACITVYGATDGSSAAVSRIVSFNGEHQEVIMGKGENGDLTFKLKDVAELLGYSVVWNGEKSSVTMENDENKMTARINAKICDKNGSLIYVASPIFIEDGHTYVTQLFLRDILGINATTGNQTEQFDGLEPGDPILLWKEEVVFNDLQDKADNGSQSWRTRPVEVAGKYVRSVLGYKGGELIYQGKEDSEFTRVEFVKEDGDSISIELYQPARKGTGGIWEVESWTDTDYRHYQVRDLSKLQPLFHHTEIPEDIREAMRNEIVSIWGSEYCRYYKVLGFEAANVRYVEADGKMEAKIFLKIITQNYYKDPDTAEYIRDAKAKGSSHYLLLYDEYNMARQGNFDIKITADLTADGQIDKDSMLILHNSSPNGEEYVPTDIKNYFISEPGRKVVGKITKDMSAEVARDFLHENISVGMSIDALSVLTGCAPIRVTAANTSKEMLRYDVLCADGYLLDEESDFLDIDALTDGGLSLVLFVGLDGNGNLQRLTV